MIYEKTKLPNGLRIVTVPLKNMESATVTIWANTGSRYETAKISGISHFLEHMPAKGTKKRPSAKAISEAIDSFGGEFNAGTSKEWTNYYIKCRKKKISTAFDIVSDMILDPLLKEEDIEREKGVIVEEIGMYEDTPMYRISDLFEQLIFQGNPLGRDIIGTRDTVRSLKRSDFVRYRNKHYGSNSIVVTVSGGVTSKEVQKYAQEHLSGLTKIPDTTFTEYRSKQTKPRSLVEYKKIEQAHIILGYDGLPRGHKDRFTEAVMTTILGGGMSSRLFTEVREKRGLAYSVSSSADHYDDTGYVETYAGIDPKRIDEALKVIQNELYELANGNAKIEPVELLKAKEFLKGHIALSLEDTKSINRFVGIRELKTGKIETPQDVYDRIDRVTEKDVISLASSIFKKEKANLAVIGPFKDKSKFEKLLT